MPIPAFNQLGLLPEGMHDCDLTEAQKRFGSFQGSDRRSRLWAKFMDFVHLARTDRFIEELLIDGSFVTANLEDKTMIETPEQLYQAIEQMGRMQRILESYRNEILTSNARNFAMLAERPLEHLRQLQAQVDQYVQKIEATPA
jgi:hypothetical protein